ncbi:LysR family transcriptional regulator [Burkholderia sp. AU30280]|uniref:LysR family transcriptional regulator n=1 Tax=Burkholderia sp. AU30280 TaxID=2879628 RepID=UPI001CF0D743|nr:LysR family transcriptional regulator [Burkholderia sp. AU30280]MCA8275657.1 LysR family transcriptional regulator [Burkholderia sp. AU30280]
MNRIDLNLLLALKALIDEESVSGAARSLDLSPSAMSRTLARVQDAIGDKVLVRAGKGMVATETARRLKEPLDRILQDVELLLGAQHRSIDAQRVFNISANDGFIDSFAVPIIAQACEAWPHARLRFLPKHEKTVARLRSGEVDIEIGVVGETGPEIMIRKLFDDRMVGVLRKGHRLARRRMTLDAYLSVPHISVSRKGRFHGPIDDALSEQGRERNVIAVVPSFKSGIELAQRSDWIAHVPEKHTAEARRDVVTFDLPVATPALAISIMWHPRFERDAVHAGLRDLIVNVCRQIVGATKG